MTKRNLLIALFIASTLASTIRGEESAVIYLAASESEKIAAKEGQKVTVHGTTKNSSKSASGTSYVNFEETDFYLVTFSSDLDQFEEGSPDELYDAKRIAVDGVISIYKGKPQIKLTSPDQIKILAEDEVFPPKVDKPVTPEKAKTKEMKKTPLTPQKPTEEEAKPKPPVDPKKYFK